MFRTNIKPIVVQPSHNTQELIHLDPQPVQRNFWAGVKIVTTNFIQLLPVLNYESLRAYRDRYILGGAWALGVLQNPTKISAHSLNATTLWLTSTRNSIHVQYFYLLKNLIHSLPGLIDDIILVSQKQDPEVTQRLIVSILQQAKLQIGWNVLIHYGMQFLDLLAKKLTLNSLLEKCKALLNPNTPIGFLAETTIRVLTCFETDLYFKTKESDVLPMHDSKQSCSFMEQVINIWNFCFGRESLSYLYDMLAVWTTLGVNPVWTEKAKLSKLYRAFALGHHPDKTSSPSNIAWFKYITEAKNRLQQTSKSTITYDQSWITTPHFSVAAGSLTKNELAFPLAIISGYYMTLRQNMHLPTLLKWGGLLTFSQCVSAREPNLLRQDASRTLLRSSTKLSGSGGNTKSFEETVGELLHHKNISVLHGKKRPSSMLVDPLQVPTWLDIPENVDIQPIKFAEKVIGAKLSKVINDTTGWININGIVFVTHSVTNEPFEGDINISLSTQDCFFKIDKSDRVSDEDLRYAILLVGQLSQTSGIQFAVGYETTADNRFMTLSTNFLRNNATAEKKNSVFPSPRASLASVKPLVPDNENLTAHVRVNTVLVENREWVTNAIISPKSTVALQANQPNNIFITPRTSRVLNEFIAIDKKGGGINTLFGTSRWLVTEKKANLIPYKAPNISKDAPGTELSAYVIESLDNPSPDHAGRVTEIIFRAAPGTNFTIVPMRAGVHVDLYSLDNFIDSMVANLLDVVDMATEGINVAIVQERKKGTGGIINASFGQNIARMLRVREEEIQKRLSDPDNLFTQDVAKQLNISAFDLSDNIRRVSLFAQGSDPRTHIPPSEFKALAKAPERALFNQALRILAALVQQEIFSDSSARQYKINKLAEAIATSTAEKLVLFGAAGNSFPYAQDVLGNSKYAIMSRDETPGLISIGVANSSMRIRRMSSPGESVTIAALGPTTSRATPVVSGMLLVLQSMRIKQGKPLLNAKQTKQLLRTTAIDNPDISEDREGAGFFNKDAFLREGQRL